MTTQVINQVLTVQELGMWLRNYASYYHVVDPTAYYTLEIVNIFPEGEPGTVEEIRIKRVL